MTVEELADAINRNPVWQSPLFSWMLSLFTATHLPVLPEGAQSSAFEGAQSTSGAKQIATDFLKYVGKHDLHDAVLAMTPTQVQVVAILHARLQARPRKRVQLSDRWEFLQQKPRRMCPPVRSTHQPHRTLRWWQTLRTSLTGKQYFKRRWSASFAGRDACLAKLCGGTVSFATTAGASIANA